MDRARDLILSYLKDCDRNNNQFIKPETPYQTVSGGIGFGFIGVHTVRDDGVELKQLLQPVFRHRRIDRVTVSATRKLQKLEVFVHFKQSRCGMCQWWHVFIVSMALVIWVHVLTK